ncbi:MAG: TRAP transporter substrate-binding protein DctP [Deltaproteobacteria bacterium]|nr:TRAP transporter substrate-binding protein DctP [Deltaproteobacteria bacterium]
MKCKIAMKTTGLVLLACTLLLAFAAPHAAAQQRILRLAAIQPLDHDLTQACLHMAQLVGERSNGRLKIEVYPAGQLFNDKDMPKALPSGAVDLAQVTTGIWVGLVPALGIIELPFLFKDMDHVTRTFDDPVFRQILDDEMAKKGIKLLFRQTWGYSFGYASKEPLHKIEEFKGKRIRAHGEMPAEIIKSLGAAPVFMGTGDVYLGLQRGTIDGVNTAPCLAWDKKYYEVIRHFQHLPAADLMSPPIVLMSMKTWNDLAADLQKIIVAAAQDTEAWSLKLSNERSMQCAKSLQEKKVQVYNVPDEERQRWAKACSHIIKQYVDRNGEVGKKLVAEVERNRE